MPTPPSDIAWTPRPVSAAFREEFREWRDARRFSMDAPPPELVARLGEKRPPAFRDTLLGMIRERALVDSSVCAAAGVDRRHYSKIRNDPEWRPSKTTAVSFAFALRLGPAEANRLLRSAGYAFSDASDFDLICLYFLESGRWNPNDVNDALWSYGQPLVCGAAVR